MLVREKKRAAWSLAIGLAAATSVAAWSELHARGADERARELVAKCQAGPAPPKGYTLVCSPDQFKPTPPSELTGQLKVIADGEEDARSA